jgi:hypothetical protein
MYERPPYPFVSYSSTDQAQAEALADGLNTAGIECFFDRKNVDPGDNFKMTISGGLERCTDLILIVSRSSLQSPWVFFELGQAVAFRRRILTFVKDPGIELPSFLSELHHARSVDEIVAYFQRRSAAVGRPRGLLITKPNDARKPDSVLLAPSEGLKRSMDRLPPTLFHGHVAIDGAVELHTFPNQANQYGGISRSQCRTISTDLEWSDVAFKHLPAQKLALLGERLKSWIGTRRAKPNRIRFLVEPPAQMVIDNNEFQMKIGNSDYFTMRTVNALSASPAGPQGDDPIRAVFDHFWGEANKPFPDTAVPYHISSHGILIVTDPETHKKYLILTLPNRQRTPLVPGWNASFAEQMWAPMRRSYRPSWWEAHVTGLTVEPPSNRSGDSDIWQTVLRGLDEELGIQEADLSESPKLIASCIEQDMYFVAFIFVIQAELTLAQLQERRLRAPDKEVGPIAAYPLSGTSSDGKTLEPLTQIINLLSQESFDGGPFLIPGPVESLVDRWHLSSRLRIYAAARHLEGNRLLDYVQLAT